MRSWLGLAALCAVVAALGAWVYVRPDPSQAQSHALAALAPGDVRRIQLERSAPSEAAPIVLARADGHWRVVQPYSARADASQVERLLGVLSARSSVRLAADDRARYGLDAPQAKLTLNEQTFLFGAVNTMTREQYVMAGDAVYAMPLAQRTAFPREAAALVSKSLFAPGETPVRFELPGFTAALDGGRWTFSPAQPDLSADHRNAWADAWRHATALAVSPHRGETPREDIHVTLADGRSVTLGILQREPELVLARADEGLRYHFLADAAKRLLAPPPPPR